MKKTHTSKSLPKPPSTPFGRKTFREQQEDQELIADRMAAAAAAGKLEEFLKKEMPDSEYAKTLANMMMGMTGMMPGIDASISPSISAEKPVEPTSAVTPSGRVPEEVREAIKSGDVQGLMGLLRKEHQKRSPDSMQEQTVQEQPPALQNMPTIDKDLIDALVAIAKDNSVSLDWIILRAIKVYVEEYRKTGKL